MSPTYNKSKKKGTYEPATPLNSFKVNKTQISIWPNKTEKEGIGFLTFDRVLKVGGMWRKSKYFPVEEIGDVMAALNSASLYCTDEIQKFRKKKSQEFLKNKKPSLGDDPDDDEFEEDDEE